MRNQSETLTSLIVFFVFFLGGLASWITHIVVCLSAGKWGFLIAGSLFFPIAMMHGVGIWVGVW